MTEITITIEDIPATTAGQVAKIVHFKGQLDESNVDEKAKTIYAILEQNPQNLHLLMDFEGLEYMNSKSIGYLTDWYGKISEGKGKIVIAKAKSNILDILQVVGLTQLINSFNTMDEAKFALLKQDGVAAAPATTTAPAAPVVAAPVPAPAVPVAPAAPPVSATPAPVAPTQPPVAPPQ